MPSFSPRLAALVATPVLALLAGCAGLTPLEPGASAEQVRSAWGAPTLVRPNPDGGERWIYGSGPEGRTAWRLDFDTGQRLRQRSQGLTFDEIRQIEIGHSRDAVEHRIGPEYYSLRYPLKPEERVAIYRFWHIDRPTCLYIGYREHDGAERVSSIGLRDEARPQRWWRDDEPLRPC